MFQPVFFLAVKRLAKQSKVDLTLPPLLIHVQRKKEITNMDMICWLSLFSFFERDLSCQVNGSGSFVIFTSVSV